jgi:putative glutamine amidotransferase
LIGITSYLEQATQGPWDQRFAMLPEQYLLAVELAGGIPVLLPPQPAAPATIARVLDAVDGLVLSGGADVDPALYGARREPNTQPPRTDRDAWERALALEALERDTPLLAICRGMQLLNASLGGTLIQHLPDVGADDHGLAPGAFEATEVEIVDGTRVRDVLGSVGDRLSVQCHHHQALRDVADGLVVAARASDGVIEAVELPARRFVLGVQWHPEQDAADRRLFAALVDAAADVTVGEASRG